MRRESTFASMRLVIAATALTACSHSTLSSGDRNSMIYEEKEGQMTLREHIISPETEKQVEFLWIKPKSSLRTQNGYPTLILLHAHQEPARPGAKEWAKLGMLNYFSNQGILTAAVSLPGYGSSDGPSDYAGTKAANAIKAVIKRLKQEGAQPGHIALWGAGKGATAAALAAENNPDISGVVLLSPVINPSLQMQRLKVKGDVISLKAADLMEKEGITEDAQTSSTPSLITVAPLIHAPVLYVGGAKDEWIDVDQAAAFGQALTANGGWASIQVLEDYNAYIPADIRNGYVFPFLKSVLKQAPAPTQPAAGANPSEPAPPTVE